MPQFWAGYIEDKIDTREVDTGWGGWGVGKCRLPAIFTSRAEARQQYKDVRKIEVRVVGK